MKRYCEADIPEDRQTYADAMYDVFILNKKIIQNLNILHKKLKLNISAIEPCLFETVLENIHSKEYILIFRFFFNLYNSVAIQLLFHTSFANLVWLFFIL